MAAVGYSTWGKTLFFEFYSLPPNYSDFLASTFMLGGFACPLAGYLSDRSRKRKIFLITSTAGNVMVFTAFVLASKNLFLPLAILLGVFDFLLPAMIFALPGEILGLDGGGLGMGVLNLCLNIGVVTGPTIIGLILDITSNARLSFLSMAGYMAIALILTFALKTR